MEMAGFWRRYRHNAGYRCGGVIVGGGGGAIDHGYGAIVCSLNGTTHAVACHTTIGAKGVEEGGIGRMVDEDDVAFDLVFAEGFKIVVVVDLYDFCCYSLNGVGMLPPRAQMLMLWRPAFWEVTKATSLAPRSQ